MGALVGFSFLYSYVEMKTVWFSVWCLEAAILSLLIFLSIRPAKSSPAIAAAMTPGARSGREPRPGDRSLAA
jgi:hypothetical protein